MVAGDDGCEAYTAIMWSGILSREILNLAEAETVVTVEGNMLCTVMQGATALPRSETPLRMKGKRRNLGDLASPKPLRRGRATTGSRGGEAVAGRGEESDGRIVPGKPRTKPTTNRWRRWWREGGRPEGRRAATHAPGSVPDLACHRSREPADRGCMGRQTPNLDRVRPSAGARCGKAARRDLRGGAGATRSPTATRRRRGVAGAFSDLADQSAACPASDFALNLPNAEVVDVASVSISVMTR